MLKLKNPKTTSPSNADLAPLPERRRSTFREPAAEVDLGLFGLPKGDPEVDDVPDLAADLFPRPRPLSPSRRMSLSRR